MTLSNSSPSLFLLPLLLALSSPAAALQILDAKDGETVLGKISQKEVTRISVERGRIRKVTGNTGEFVLEKDEDKGQIFIRPVSPDSTKPINLFITSERSTIGLVLQPVDTPSDTIVIREGRDPLNSTSRMEKSGRHVRTIKNLLLAMAGDALPDDMEVREPTQELALWPGVRLNLLRQHPVMRMTELLPLQPVAVEMFSAPCWTSPIMAPRPSFMRTSACSKAANSSLPFTSMCCVRSPSATAVAKLTAEFSGPVMERVMNIAEPMPTKTAAKVTAPSIHSALL